MKKNLLYACFLAVIALAIILLNSRVGTEPDEGPAKVPVRKISAGSNSGNVSNPQSTGSSSTQRSASEGSRPTAAHLAEVEASKAILKPPVISGSNGTITSKAAEALSLADKDREALADLIRTLRGNISDVAKTHLLNDSENSDLANGVTAYRISAFPIEGARLFEDFKSEVRQLLGEEKAATFLKLFTSSLYYGNMGRNDMFFVFQEASIGDGVAIGLRYREVNPSTGKTELVREASFDRVSHYLPDVFSAQIEQR